MLTAESPDRATWGATCDVPNYHLLALPRLPVVHPPLAHGTFNLVTSVVGLQNFGRRTRHTPEAAPGRSILTPGYRSGLHPTGTPSRHSRRLVIPVLLPARPMVTLALTIIIAFPRLHWVTGLRRGRGVAATAIGSSPRRSRSIITVSCSTLLWVRRNILPAVRMANAAHSDPSCRPFRLLATPVRTRRERVCCEVGWFGLWCRGGLGDDVGVISETSSFTDPPSLSQNVPRRRNPREN